MASPTESTTGIDIPSLPIGQAANQILQGQNVGYAFAVIELGAIMFLVWWILRVYKDLDEARREHIEDVKIALTSLHEFKDLLVSSLQRRSR